MAAQVSHPQLQGHPLLGLEVEVVDITLSMVVEPLEQAAPVAVEMPELREVRELLTQVVVVAVQ
jgi:hypothetical protein